MPANSLMATIAIHHHHHHDFKPSTSHRHCRLRSFPHPDPILLDLDSSSPPSFHRSLSTPCFSTKTTTSTSTSTDEPTIARVEIIGGRRAPGVHALVVEAAVALASGSRPIPASSTGLSAAYLLRNRSGNSFAVVKPADEEPLTRWRPSGEAGAPREVAAYLLDHGGFSGVPPTALIKISHPAFHNISSGILASIQRFVPHNCDAGDLGPSRFSIESVHRIGILDVRLLNVDRHAGNILVRKGAKGNELVPIDHGLCLPETLEDPYFEWLHWPQAVMPFGDAEAEYIASLDPSDDAELLRSELPSLKEASIRIFLLCTRFLKKAVEAGFCLADIGGMMTRDFRGLEESPSALEALCKRALDAVTCIRDDGGRNLYGHNELFQLELECSDEKDDEDDKGNNDKDRCLEEHIEEVLEIPMLLEGKPSMMMEGEEEEDQEEEEEEEDLKVVMSKSMSFSASKMTHEIKCISFGGLSEDEWVVFLEKFEHLMLHAFKDKKSIGLRHKQRQRLGTSCKF